jgi:hypothetical protein
MRNPKDPDRNRRQGNGYGWRLFGRPAGLTVLALFLAAKGLGSLVAAVGFVTGSGERGPGPPNAVVVAVIGLLLVHRAYALWTYHRGAWLITLLTMIGACLTDIFALSVAPGLTIAWVDLALSVAVTIYLLHPRVRSLFGGTTLEG